MTCPLNYSHSVVGLHLACEYVGGERDYALTADCTVHAKKLYENETWNGDGEIQRVQDAFEGMKSENTVMATGGKEMEKGLGDLNDGAQENANAMVCGESESVVEANDVEMVGEGLARRYLLLGYRLVHAEASPRIVRAHSATTVSTSTRSRAFPFIPIPC